MCGICGIIKFNNSLVEEEKIRIMMKTMKHRGPDDEGLFVENNVGIGFVRLSIIDLSPLGHQPMLDETKRFVIIHNGEVYNYIELREELIKHGFHFHSKTDTEVILKAYILWGEKCLERFNGMWAFVIYDREKGEIFCARDRYGIKPFYYYLDNDQFVFASEIPPVLKVLDHKPQPNEQVIFDYLVFNRTDQTEATFFKEIRKLQHGHTLKINLKELSSENHFKGIKISKWYDLKERVNNTEGFHSPEEFRELFSSAVGLRLRSDVPVGVCLSGGLDSSSIVSVLLKDYDFKEINTFSAVYGRGITGDESEFINEFRPLVKNMHFTSPSADTLQKDLENFIIAHGEPIPSTSPYAQFKVMELAKKHVVVTLDGQGADELLAGYHYFYGFYFKELLKKYRLGKLFNESYSYLSVHRSLFGLKSFIFFLFPLRIRQNLRVSENNYLTKEFINLAHESVIADKLYGSETLNDALLNHFEYKLEHLLKWEDRNSMYFSLEARVPFLDFRLVEKTLATDSDKKINKGITKVILRDALRGTIPEKIRLRKDKVGFETPEAEWFREPAFQKIINDIFNAEKFSKRGIVDQNKVKQLYRMHLERKKDFSREIWKWINLEYWFREFVD